MKLGKKKKKRKGKKNVVTDHSPDGKLEDPVVKKKKKTRESHVFKTS